MPTSPMSNRAHSPSTAVTRDGFTLVEILASLGLCAMLVTTVASVITMTTRQEQRGLLQNQAILELHRMYYVMRMEEAEAAPTFPVDTDSPWQYDRHIAPTPDRPLADHILDEWPTWKLVEKEKRLPPIPLSLPPVKVATPAPLKKPA